MISMQLILHDLGALRLQILESSDNIGTGPDGNHYIFFIAELHSGYRHFIARAHDGTR